MGRGISRAVANAVGVAVVVAAVVGNVANARPKPEEMVVGAQAVFSGSAAAGFVDDVVAVDGDRFVYVVADGTMKAALHVANVGTKDEQIVDISTLTLQPVALRVMGERALVVGIEKDKQVAGLVELGGKKAGKLVYRIGPADHITPVVHGGKPRLALHRQTELTGITKHTVEIVAIENGRRVQAGKLLALGPDGEEKKLEFRVNHWSDGWTRAHGIKAGAWDRKEDQRAPDQEATFDLVTGKLERKKIEDLFDQKRRFGVLRDAEGKLDFVRLDAKPDGSTLQLWRGGKSRTLELDQPLSAYDGKSLQYVVNADGSGWLALKVDPVNPDAVARKKADLEYLDIFTFAADGKATRKARVYAKGMRHRFGVAGNKRFWLIERNAGFERGGKTVTLYQLP